MTHSKTFKTGITTALLLLLPLLSLAQSGGNALASGHWREALQKCAENATIRFSNGVYKGDTIDGVCCGLGMYYWNDGTFYIGGWSNVKEGLGIYIAPKGFVVNNCLQSPYYIGEWFERKTGLGLCFDGNGNVNYAGPFENDKPVETYPMTGFSHDKLECKDYGNGNYYVGMTKDGKPDGLGIYIWKDGGLWYGEWKDGQREGLGMYMPYKGAITHGTWKANALLNEKN